MHFDSISLRNNKNIRATSSVFQLPLENWKVQYMDYYLGFGFTTEFVGKIVLDIIKRLYTFYTIISIFENNIIVHKLIILY